MGNVVELPDKDIKKGFRLVTLFEEAEAEQDDYGLWQVRLECTQNAMKYFFNVENLGYLRYKLRCITSLTSRYTYIMFIYLEANRFRKSWNVALDELKSILHCDNEEYAKEFKYFNRDVLKKVQKELLEKTECRYSYEPIKKGRKVVAVRFAVETLSDILPDTAPDESQISFDDVEKLLSTDHGQVLYMLSGACQDEFTTEQMEILFTLCTSKCIPQVSENPNNDKYHYLAKMYAKLNYEATKKNIPYRFSYFQTMIENDEL